MYLDHRTATAVQRHRAAQLRRAAARRHALDDLTTAPEPQARRWTVRALLARFRPRHA